METRASYALIGGALVAGLAAMAAFVVWLGQVQFNRSYALYDVVFTGAVNGLSEGGQVRYLGINVGEVSQLSLDKDRPGSVIAQIRIDAETPVRTDSKAFLDFAGLTGVTFIQIRPGSEGAPLMAKRTGGDIPIIETEQTQLAMIFDDGQDLLATAQVTLAQLNDVLDEENRDSLKVTLQNIEVITGALAKDEALLEGAADALSALADAGRAVGAAADAFNTFGSEAGGYMEDLVAGAQALFDDARKAVTRAEAAIGETEAAMSETQEAITEPAAEAADEVRLMAHDLRLLVRRLDRIAREVEQNPQAFIQGSPKPYKED